MSSSSQYMQIWNQQNILTTKEILFKFLDNKTLNLQHQFNSMDRLRSKPKFTFCHSDNVDDGLVMLMDKQSILQKLLIQPCQQKFWWFATNFTPQIQQLRKTLQNSLEIQITVCLNLNQLKREVSSYQLKRPIVLICEPPSFLQVIALLNQNQIECKSILCYPVADNIEIEKLMAAHKKCFAFKSDSVGQASLKKVIRSNLNRRQKILPNFVGLRNQVKKSHNMAQTIYAMLNVKLSEEVRKKLINELDLLIQEIQKANPAYVKDKKYKIFLKQIQQKEMGIQNIFKWYTCQSSVHKIVNNLLRLSCHPCETFYIQPYFKQLFEAIRFINRKNNTINTVEEENGGDFQYYRGGYMSEQQLTLMQNSVGGIIQNLGFFSTSLSRQTAVIFSQNVLFIIKGNRNRNDEKLNYGYANLNNISQFAEEQQILFNALNSFRILSVGKSIQKISNFQGQIEKQLYFIQLEYGYVNSLYDKNQSQLDGEEKIIKILTLMQINEKQQILYQGDALLTKRQLLFGGDIYWQKYNQLSRDFQNKEKGIFKLAICKQNLLNFHEAKKLYFRYHYLIQNKYGRKHEEFAKSLNFVANAYSRQGQHNHSISLYEQSLRIKKQVFGQKSYSYAGTLNNLGHAYCSIGEFEKALNFHKQSLKIFTRTYGRAHPDCTKILQDIADCQLKKTNVSYILQFLEWTFPVVKAGKKHRIKLYEIYNYLQNSKRSLNYFRQALLIKQTFLGPNHPDCGSTLQKIAGSFYNLKNYRMAFKSFHKCLYIYRQNYEQSHPEIILVKKMINFLKIQILLSQNSPLYQALREDWSKKDIIKYSLQKRNKVVNGLLSNTQQQMKELFKMCINDLHQIMFFQIDNNKTYNPFLITIEAKLSQFYVKLGDKMQAEKHNKMAKNLKLLESSCRMQGNHEKFFCFMEKIFLMITGTLLEIYHLKGVEGGQIQFHNILEKNIILFEDDEIEKVGILNKLAIIHFKMGQYDKAITFLQQCRNANFSYWIKYNQVHPYEKVSETNMKIIAREMRTMRAKKFNKSICSLSFQFL